MQPFPRSRAVENSPCTNCDKANLLGLMLSIALYNVATLLREPSFPEATKNRYYIASIKVANFLVQINSDRIWQGIGQHPNYR